MNRLTIKELNFEVDFNNPSSILIAIENKEYLFKFLLELFGERYDRIMNIYDIYLQKNYTKDDFEYIDSLIALDINNKKNINAVVKQIKKIYSSEINNFLNSENEKMNSLFDNIKLHYPIELDTDLNFKVDDYLKILNISIIDDYDSLLEKVVKYIKATIALRDIKYVILNNISTYLSSNDIQVLIHELELMNITLICIECASNNSEVFDYSIVIDKDLCILQTN